MHWRIATVALATALLLATGCGSDDGGQAVAPTTTSAPAAAITGSTVCAQWDLFSPAQQTTFTRQALHEMRKRGGQYNDGPAEQLSDFTVAVARECAANGTQHVLDAAAYVYVVARPRYGP